MISIVVLVGYLKYKNISQNDLRVPKLDLANFSKAKFDEHVFEDLNVSFRTEPGVSPVQQQNKVVFGHFSEPIGTDGKVSTSDMPYINSLEIFNKSESDSFEKSVYSIVLKSGSFNQSTCKINIQDEKQESFQVARIIPEGIKKPDSMDGYEDYREKVIKQCSEIADGTFGDKFFLYDQSHPDKILYISLPINELVRADSSNSKYWFETIEFIK